MFKKTLIVLGLLVGMSVTFPSAAEGQGTTKLARGKYLVEIGGCNDCHTAGYAASGGKVPEPKWLLGDKLGYSGPWGTTYPINLREYFSKISESEWVRKAKSLKAKPPMPFWALNAMSDTDLRAIYEFINSLGVVKSTVPADLPPGVKPKTAFIQWPAPPK